MRKPALCLLLFLAACAERWEKPGVTEAEADAAQSVCTTQAAEQVRPAMVRMQTMPGRWQQAGQYGGRIWVPPIYSTVDVNIPIRREARAKCLAEQGFAYKGLRPLRLF